MNANTTLTYYCLDNYEEVTDIKGCNHVHMETTYNITHQLIYLLQRINYSNY